MKSLWSDREAAAYADDDLAMRVYSSRLLGANEGDIARISHPEPVLSFAHVRAKMHGTRFGPEPLAEVLRDAVAGRYSDVQIAAFLTACATAGLDGDETVADAPAEETSESTDDDEEGIKT